jgi:biopolymer transport protein ExbB
MHRPSDPKPSITAMHAPACRPDVPSSPDCHHSPSGNHPVASRRSGCKPWRSMLLLLAALLPLLTCDPIVVAQAPDPSAAEAIDAPVDVPVDGETIRAILEPNVPRSDLRTGGSEPTGIDLLSLILRGGGFMIPIGLMSMLVVTLAVERMLNLRRKRLIPVALVNELQRLADPIERFSPSSALAACRAHPSAAATAIAAMLLRTGQPLADVERAATDAVQREADDQAAPIRWLSLAAAATPLMGLLGTVWGMIMAFHESTTLTPDRSRSEQLSEGIYVALVTTLAGLVVAIPAAILAQYLENRLAKHFHKIERLAFSVAPALIRFVGRARLDPDGSLHPLAAPTEKTTISSGSAGGHATIPQPPSNRPPVGPANSVSGAGQITP